MCEVLGLCYFSAEHCCFVCCSADHDALYNRVSQDRDRRTLQCQVYFYSCNSLVLTLTFMQAKKATFNRYKWYVFLPFSAEISVEFLMFLKMGHSDLYAYFSAKEVKKNNLNMKGSTFIS